MIFSDPMVLLCGTVFWFTSEPGNRATIGDVDGGVVPRPAISSGMASQLALKMIEDGYNNTGTKEFRIRNKVHTDVPPHTSNLLSTKVWSSFPSFLCQQQQMIRKDFATQQHSFRD